MLPAICKKLIPVFSFILLFFTPIRSGAQIVGADWCRVTIESVKCIKPSTGQDAYTAFLFKGIEIAVQAAAAMASGGSSLTATAATQIAKDALKKTVKTGLKMVVKNQAKNFYAANKEEILALAGLGNNGGGGGGGGSSDFAKMAGVAKEVLEYTSLQGLFNKVYGESPDDLYIRLNGYQVWPTGRYESMKSQQERTVGYSFETQKSTPFTVQLMEYDSGSSDDNLNSLSFKIPPNFVGTDWLRDQVIQHEEEGSLYTITLRVETVNKHRFIHNLAYSGWDVKLDNQPFGMVVFEDVMVRLLDHTDPLSKGYTWGITGSDQVTLFNQSASLQFLLKFDSENSFSGVTKGGTDNKVMSVTGTRRPSMHRFINNLPGSSWKQTNAEGDVILTYMADGTIQVNNGLQGLTWQVTGPDKIVQCMYNFCDKALTFTSENEVTGEYIFPGAPANAVYTAARVTPSGQRITAQTQNLQHRFINQIVGTSWDITDPAGGNVSFTFFKDRIVNVTPAGTFWDGVTWQVAGMDMIELRATNGATMNLTFTDQNNFSGASWFDKSKVATGTNRKAQQQQQQPLQSSETLPSRHINNITGTTWYLSDAAGGNVRFTFGQGNIINISPTGTFWNAVTWKVASRDHIELKASNGAVMNLYFSDPNNFTGFSWANQNMPVSGTTKSQTGEPEQNYISSLVGSTWTYTEGPAAVYTFTFGNGVITNFSSPGSYWDRVTWSVVSPNVIALRAPEGQTMNLAFTDRDTFAGSFWNNGMTPVSGKRN